MEYYVEYFGELIYTFHSHCCKLLNNNLSKYESRFNKMKAFHG